MTYILSGRGGKLAGNTDTADDAACAASKTLSAAKGAVIPMEQIPDEVFSQGTLGKCCAINPTEGKVYSPVSGVISMVPDTKHAIGITADNGAEVLIHVGLDTVSMKGDGELAEGQVWEAVMFAAHYKLDNLCIAVDVNGLQIDGWTKDVMNAEPIDKKFEAFGCAVIVVDGHDFAALEKGFAKFHETKGSGKPTVILLQTVKGKGVSFMENVTGWHGKAPNDEQLAQALAELENARNEIEEA